ncbi:MAG TPA: response regulator transcription factor [Streptosporangiaceae bacterium]
MIDVYIAEYQQLRRGALACLLAAEEGIRVVGETGCAETTLTDVPRLRPAVVVVSDDIRGPAGSAFVARLRTQTPAVRILALGESAHPAAEGIDGYARHAAPAHELAETIRSIAGQDPVARSEAAGHGGQAPPGSPLTARERSVLSAVSSGASLKETGGVLGLSVAIIRSYLSAAMSKTGAGDGADAARIATVNGWM